MAHPTRNPSCAPWTPWKHRGPDGSGISRFDGAVLGHTRLALVDVGGGAQPITSEDGSVACVVSGELYDDAAIRRELESRGHRFRSRSDSELVVHLYEEHGDAFVGHLRGEFAVIVWDVRRRRLVCARDRFGVRPLVWARTPAGVAVASEAKALFALGLGAEWDMEAVWASMCAQYALPHQTLFRGVQQVPPGHLLVVERDRCTGHAYWDLSFPVQKRGVTSTEVRAALDEAVALRLRGDHARVACTLSGGLDSSSIAALAAARGSIECFTLSFSQSAAYDEVAVAERTARALGVPSTSSTRSRRFCGTRCPPRSPPARDSPSTSTWPPSGCSREG